MAIRWIFLCLQALGAPLGFISFTHFLYHEVDCFLKHAGTLHFMTIITSGVIQGCPLGASLFIIGMEPFVRMLVHRIILPEIGIVNLCADDIAVVLRSWQSLDAVATVFDDAQACANLTLKITKCTLVPLSSPLSLSLRSSLSDYLASHVPQWCLFKVESAAKYLGVWIGPTAGDFNWVEACTKFLTRVRLISASQVAVSQAVKVYNVKAITVFAYLTQLLPPPPSLTRLEKYAFTKIFEIP